jgi:hypothetical protein
MTYVRSLSFSLCSTYLPVKGRPSAVYVCPSTVEVSLESTFYGHNTSE